MTEEQPPEAVPSVSGEPAAQDLGRSYGSLLDRQPWEVDAGDFDMPAAEESMTQPQAKSPPPTEPPSPLRIVEALLFVGGAPLTAARACEMVRGLTPAQFAETLDTLNRTYRRQGRPYTIQAQGPGYVLALRPRYQAVLEKLYGTMREARLSQAAIDVLALVAYRQPATKQEIDSLRGADSGALLRQLVRRGLIAVVHRGEASQRQVSYGTTQRFLELFRLRSLDDLPQTQDLQRL
ncbi:MAG TPA: SMC-Scp complex subunit ScpB [Gemmataceae bacterium]|nr:SMC-Scp complex subunit ScpB [Gemmataceae bacterium]